MYFKFLFSASLLVIWLYTVIFAGRDGYIPTYDPTGDIYNDGPQFGCIRPGPKLRYRFMILVSDIVYSCRFHCIISWAFYTYFFYNVKINLKVLVKDKQVHLLYEHRKYLVK